MQFVRRVAWLGCRDSNPDTTVQSRMSCRWTTPQHWAAEYSHPNCNGQAGLQHERIVQMVEQTPNRNPCHSPHSADVGSPPFHETA